MHHVRVQNKRRRHYNGRHNNRSVNRAYRWKRVKSVAAVMASAVIFASVGMSGYGAMEKSATVALGGLAAGFLALAMCLFVWRAGKLAEDGRAYMSHLMRIRGKYMPKIEHVMLLWAAREEWNSDRREFQYA